MRHVEGLNEVDVKIPWGRRRGALIGRTKEQVSLARGLALQPFNFVLPYLVASYISLVGAFHDPSERLVVVAVKL